MCELFPIDEAAMVEMAISMTSEADAVYCDVQFDLTWLD